MIITRGVKWISTYNCKDNAKKPFRAWMLIQASFDPIKWPCSLLQMGVLWKHSLCLAAPAHPRVPHKSTLFRFLALPGFTAALQSRTVLDSRDGDYPPWSFRRQEIVRCKKKKKKPPLGPYHLRTDRHHISMNQGREKKWFRSFWPSTWLEKRGESGEAVQLLDARPVPDCVCFKKIGRSNWVLGFFCIVQSYMGRGSSTGRSSIATNLILPRR